MDQSIQYIGEHLWPGKIGHFSIILSFTALLFTCYAYYKDTNQKESLKVSWRSLARIGFGLHTLSIFTLIGIIFYAMINQYYEYSYVFEHVSPDLPMQYIFSAFWEGQEGSFLLWMIWHCVLGLILIKTAKTWESPVMLFVCLTQAIINSMILGIHIEIGDFVYKFGSNPTLLLRDVFEAPIFNNADYLVSITGNGLNPLLQNYWMTIHPPTLFLGFASTTIPFAFAAAGFYTKQYKEWLNPAMKWALFSTGILGIGILMGGAWAYEALTFGGYWAWDPVENMSLVPWLIFVAGVHTHLIARSTGRAIKSTFVYYCLGFVLILYSTYLTRSGILGDTSVHAFTEMGLEWQLIFMVVFFAVLSTVLYFRRSKLVPVLKEEESIYSREFWMFVGALILLFSGVIIASSTSLPVFNAIAQLFNEDFVGTVIQDPIPHYNKFQIWIAILITILSSKAIFLRYKTEDWSKNQMLAFAKQNLIFAAIAGVLTIAISFWLELWHWKYYLLCFCAFFAITANLAYLANRLKFNLKLGASAISHFGFAVMIIGILASGLNERVITKNPFVMQGLIKDDDLANTIKLIKNEPMYSEGYWITYESDTIRGQNRYFKVKFEKDDSIKGKGEPFYLYPNALFSNDLTKVATINPDTKHHLSEDIFVSISGLPKAQMDVKFAKEEEDSLQYVNHVLAVGDTIFTSKNYGIVEYIKLNPEHEDYVEEEHDLGLGVGIRFYDLSKSFNELVEPALGLRDNLLYHYADKIDALGVKVRLNEKTFDNFFSQEDQLQYTEFELTSGQSFEYEGETFILDGFDRNITHRNYKAQENDIAIQARIVNEATKEVLSPVYVIRNSSPMSIKDYQVTSGYHIRLSHIDPVAEQFVIQMATDERIKQEVEIEIAENAPRSDIIILEAKVFPGINLFWLGSCLMLAGFFIAFWNRYRSKYA